MLYDKDKKYSYQTDKKYKLYVSKIDRKERRIFLTPDPPQNVSSPKNNLLETKLRKARILKTLKVGTIIQAKYKNSIKAVKSQIKDIPACKKFHHPDANFTLQWNSPHFSLTAAGISITVTSKRAFDIAFNGTWGELVVADTVSK